MFFFFPLKKPKSRIFLFKIIKDMNFEPPDLSLLAAGGLDLVIFKGPF